MNEICLKFDDLDLGYAGRAAIHVQDASHCGLCQPSHPFAATASATKLNVVAACQLPLSSSIDAANLEFR